MAPILSDYVKEDEILAIKGTLERPISGLVMDSRRVVPGNLFFALPGLRSDGLSYVDEAVSRVTHRIRTLGDREISRPRNCQRGAVDQ